MRIVAGRWRGRTIEAPDDPRVRPTADRVREAWMSIVSPYLPEARVLDLFAGAGALGLEAISRGAAHADFVEVAAPSLRALRDNAAKLGAGELAVVHRGDAVRFAEKLEAGAYDVAFADPPYGMGLAERIAAIWLSTPFAEVLGVEHGSRERLPEPHDRRRYGTTAISFYYRDRLGEKREADG